MKLVEEIDIRILTKVDELEEVRQLESKIWGKEDSIPTHQTLTAVKNGGMVLGAFVQGTLIAFQYSFPGFNGKTAYLCSHVLGTDPEFRNKGIGEKLKWAQREEALKYGYSLITWTYDPLESINGYLNIGKLGAVSGTYIPNCYGEMEDLLNKGIPTDRFLVEWYIRRDLTDNVSVEGWSMEEAVESSVVQWKVGREGVPIISLIRDTAPQIHKPVLVAIPKNYRQIRSTNLDVAIDWRMKTRQIFTDYFERGWKVTGFKKNINTECPVHFYVLSKTPSSKV
ncbi:GNAT family N-acetyltransferase [Neobacillus sp. LXY-4]|uniref:GNAT family N-acetyltransferase n=1 Tax=Neobacillus sp. LXY-4 TaxID=3379826 RepID=UPI003EE19A2D